MEYEFRIEGLIFTMQNAGNYFSVHGKNIYTIYAFTLVEIDFSPDIDGGINQKKCAVYFHLVFPK